MSTFTNKPAALQEGSRIFRGRTTEELIPRIVTELGSDAIVLRHHKGLTGGFAGFFQRSFVEIEACRGGGQLLDRYDEDDATPALPGAFEDDASPLPGAFKDDAPPLPGAFKDDAPPLPGAFKDDAPALPGEFEDDALAPPGYDAPALSGRFADHQAQVEAEIEDQLARDTWSHGYDNANPFAAALADAEAAVRAAEPAVPPALDAALAAALADAEAAGLPVEPAISTAHDTALAAALADAEAEAEAEAIAAADAEAEAEAEAEAIATANAEAEAEAIAAADAEAAELRVEVTPLPEQDPTLANTTSFLQVESVEPSPATAPAALGRAGDEIERALLERTLLEVGFDEQFVSEVLAAAAAHLIPLIASPSSASSLSPSPLAQAVRRELQQRIPVCPPLPPGPATVALVGPGGSGKSACCATLLDAYQRRSTLPAASAVLTPTTDGAAQALHSARKEGLLLLDTPPLSPADHASIDALATMLKPLAPDRVVLALPATLGAKPAARLLEAYRPLETSALAITHTDGTDQLGVAVQVACALGLAPAYLLERNGSEWALTSIDPADLVDRLLPSQ
jgi:flagellar biosynthesis GTPase FlhF